MRVFWGITFIFIPVVVFAQSASTNYELNQQGSGFTEFSASSTNYEFRATIGEPGTALSSSPNYLVDQGTTWIEIASTSPTVTITYAIPESRTGTPGTNYDVDFFVTVRTEENTDDVVLFTSGLTTISEDGTYSTHIELTGIPPGTYDMGIKGSQHLTLVLQDVAITSGNTPLNFSTTDYALTTQGTVEMLAGDVNGDGTSAATLGDDVVNSVDISAFLTVLDTTDSTGNDIRSNINQDTVVNSVDLSVMLDNLDKEGDN